MSAYTICSCGMCTVLGLRASCKERTSYTITRKDIKQIPNKGTKSPRNRSPVEGRGMRIQILFVTNAHPSPEKYGHHAFEGNCGSSCCRCCYSNARGGDPRCAASAPITGAAAVAPAPLGSAPVLSMTTPVVRVVVVVP